MVGAKPCASPMCQNKKYSLNDSQLFDSPVYGRTIGALQYLTLIGPDIAFAVN